MSLLLWRRRRSDSGAMEEEVHGDLVPAVIYHSIHNVYENIPSYECSLTDVFWASWRPLPVCWVGPWS